MTLDNGNAAARQPRRRRSPTTTLTATRRAVIAASLVDRGFTVQSASELCCVNAAYVATARCLSKAKRLSLLRGELSLSQLCGVNKAALLEPPILLADYLVTATAAEKVEAARQYGVDRIWDELIAPVIAEEGATPQAAE
jgi:hypothetical protein